jgi:type IX secretion system PorP/SprF family membrane protein
MICANQTFSQDPEFVQFYSNPLYLNPAFAGTNNCPRISANNRIQWSGLPNVFNTTSFSFDQHINALHGGLGFIIINDKLSSSMQNIKASGIYSYETILSKKIHLRTGLEAALWQNKLNYDQLNFVDNIDPLRGFVNSTSNFGYNDSKVGFDFSAGFILYTNKIFFGASTHHLTEPIQSNLSNDSKLDRKYTLKLGYHYTILNNKSQLNKNPLIISPNIIWKMQGWNKQLNIGMYAEKGPYTAGFWFRDNKNYSLIFGAKIGLVKFGYSYGVNLSRLYVASAGSHEISMQINLVCDNKNKLYKTLSCPSF